jgi:acetylornithine deacetylase/succinyl-diaminopimelate desuccinylase-like protein
MLEVKMRKSAKYAIFLFLLAGLFSSSLNANEELYKLIRTYRKAHEYEIIREFTDLLSIPNVSSDQENIRKNAAFIQDMMTKRGIDTRIMETAGNPVVFGELEVPSAARTILIYIHYDGQPVDSSKWTDTHPFVPALRPGKLMAGTHEPEPIPFPDKGKPYEENWRIYARGSSDDRAPIIAYMAALDALKAAGIPLKNNLKFILEGEEEAGSTNLRPFLEKHHDMLSCDVLLMCDGPAYYSGDPTLFFGVRGITSLEITVYGPNTSVHSGHYGNWIPNPGIRLAHLLASMRDPDGNVKIQGWYDSCSPMSDSEMEAIQAIPSFEQQIMVNYGFAQPESKWESLMMAIQYPGLNVNGLTCGWTGAQQRTIIPPKATAGLDIRLVKGNDPDHMVGLVVDHIRQQGYHVVKQDPDAETRMKYPLIARVLHKESGYKASRTPMDHPISQAVITALSENSEKTPVLLPSLGGSLPIYLFSDLLKVPVIGVSIANHDNNQHQPDENIRIGHLWTGIETYAALMTMSGK